MDLLKYYSLKGVDREHFNLRDAECNLGMIEMLPNYNFDFEVYLPTYKLNLQREYCWDLFQQQQLIISIFKKIIRIPPVSIIHYYHDRGLSYLEAPKKVIDGKQRLMTMIRFLQEKFPLNIEGKDYYLSDLDETSQRYYRGYKVKAVIADSFDHDPISDLEIVQYFKIINFAGTPQEQAHLDRLNKALYS